MPEDARGVAAGFGLGHVEPGIESLGWEMRTHGNLDANVLKWGEFESPPKPLPPPPRKRKRKRARASGGAKNVQNPWVLESF